MKTNEGRKVNQVATVAPTTPAATRAAGPRVALVHAPTNPTKATIMINGPGVVSPSASPSIICAIEAQPNCPTALSTTYGSTA